MVDAPASASSNPLLAAVNSGTGKLGPGFLRNRPGLRCPRLRSLGMTSKTQKASIPRRHIANMIHVLKGQFSEQRAHRPRRHRLASVGCRQVGVSVGHVHCAMSE